MTKRFPIYRGFSTTVFTSKKRFLQTNQEAVTQDILNEINTAIGERPMMPSFGTRIPLLAFEPLDENTVNIVETDLRRVIKNEPRVVLNDLAVLPFPDNNSIVAMVDLTYIELGQTETLRLEFPLGT